MRYVCEWSSVHYGGCVLGGLYQVGVECILQQDAYCASDSHVLHRERLSIHGSAKQDVLYALPEVLLVLGEAEYRHYLACRRDVEAALHAYPVGLGSKSRDDAAQVAVVYVEYALPQHLLQGESLVPVLVDVVVHQCGNHVVSGCHGMEVAREVKVYPIHWKYLCVTSSGCASLHPETWPERWFPESYDGLLADPVHPQGESYADRSLPYAGLGGRDSRDQYQLVFLHLLLVCQAFVYLSCIPSVWLHLLFWYSQLACYIGYGLEFGFSCDFYVCLHDVYLLMCIGAVCVMGAGSLVLWAQ